MERFGLRWLELFQELKQLESQQSTATLTFYPFKQAIQTQGGGDLVILEEPITEGSYRLVAALDTSQVNTYLAQASAQSPEKQCLENRSNATVVGKMDIIYFDRSEKIVAGTFEFDFTYKDSDCVDTVIVTEGRFDVKFP